jgi:hypothetical protein
MSDIKFQGEWVIVEGNWTKLSTVDLMLDSPARRKTSGGLRRALVHDHDDGLTINYGRDYPGGVRINGPVSSDNNQFNLTTWDLCLDSAARRKNTTAQRRALVHNQNDGLTLNWARDYPDGVTINGPVKVPDSLAVGNTDVAGAIARLESLVQNLETKVATLEAKVQALEGSEPRLLATGDLERLAERLRTMEILPKRGEPGGPR